MSATDESRWKVGELARATGLTVRALHHYDELGLLVPSERTQAGHRLYSEDDVRRLYRILALRRLGLPLHVGGIEGIGGPFAHLHAYVGCEALGFGLKPRRIYSPAAIFV